MVGKDSHLTTWFVQRYDELQTSGLAGVAGVYLRFLKRVFNNSTQA
jgi:hypothetical protein